VFHVNLSVQVAVAESDRTEREGETYVELGVELVDLVAQGLGLEARAGLGEVGLGRLDLVARSLDRARHLIVGGIGLQSGQELLQLIDGLHRRVVVLLVLPALDEVLL